MSSPIRLSECADCFESPDCEQTAICRFIGAFATVIVPHKNSSFEAVKFYLNTKCRYSDRCKITALKGFLYTDGPFRAVSRTVQIFNNMGRQKSRQNFTFL